MTSRVQALLDARDALQGLLTERDIHNVQFKTVRLTPGYDEDEVDSFLDRVELEFQRRERLRAQDDLAA